VRHAANCLFNILDVGQSHHPEVVRPYPVEGTSVGDQDLLFLQQVQDELLVVAYVVNVWIQLGKQVEGAPGLLCADTRDRVQEVVRFVALLQEPATGQDEIVDALVAAKSCLYGVLCRDVGAQAHIGQQVDAFKVIGSILLGPGNGHPAGAVAANTVGLGQSAERQ